jgi:hypothetical protein
MSTAPNRESTQFGGGQKRNGKFFLGCFDSVRKLAQHWNKWILDDCWIDFVDEPFDIPTQLKFNADDLNGTQSATDPI